MDDDDEKIIFSSNKLGNEMLSVVKGADQESSKDEVLLRKGIEDEESSVKCESDSSFGNVFYE